MAESLREQAWGFICATFPERQVYIRSDGRVQFFTFGPLMQAIMAGISLLFLGWVAFTSVNTIFKDRIIASKENHYRQMQTSYESRIAELQTSYDELNGALVSAEDHFKSVANDLEAKHRTLASILEHKQALQASLGLTAPMVPAGSVVVTPDAPDAADPGAIDGEGDSADSADVTVPEAAAALAPGSAGQDAAPARPASAPPRIKASIIPDGAKNSAKDGRHATFINGAVQRLGSLFRNTPVTKTIDHPVLRQMAKEESRLAALFGINRSLTGEAEKQMESETRHFQQTIRIAGVDPATLVGRIEKAHGGEGGPLIPVDEDEDQDSARALAALDDMTEMVTALRSVPLTQPVVGSEYARTSGFGIRRDPFTKRSAFHAGLDFSGPWGSPVHVTAPGVVVFAGPKGAYGNTVEVDHGYGIRTRYGHMSKILVTAGTKLNKGDVVGKLGSTGRSTGPHVHYEVWYDNAVRNPSQFLKAGQYVLQD